MGADNTYGEEHFNPDHKTDSTTDDFVCTSKLRWHGGFVVGDKHILQQLWRSSRGFEEWRDIPIYNAPISERPNWLRKV